MCVSGGIESHVRFLHVDAIQAQIVPPVISVAIDPQADDPVFKAHLPSVFSLSLSLSLFGLCADVVVVVAGVKSTGRSCQ
jgi:hypothetical protein